jgi:glycerol-3-phosphate cytidylyltransferase
MKTVLTYGTYDLLHKGHVRLLQRARALGDCLIVGLSTDAFNMTKGKNCFYSYEDRFLILSAIKYVDKIIPEDSWEQKIVDIKHYDVDLFVMGDDWQGKFDHLRDYCEVVYLPRTEDVSTTLTIESISSRRATG